MKDSREIDLVAIAYDAMERYGFDPGFPETVTREVESMSEETIRGGRSDVLDLRGLLWSSVDNFDSLDLDQIEYCEEGTDGEVHVKVAIADVDFFVRKGMHTDRHAAHNGTSVYLGIVTFPMLPDDLSKDISSLLPGKERRAIVMEYTVFPDGSMSRGEIYRALVSNKAKLVYEETGDWLEGRGPMPAVIEKTPGLEKQVRLQVETSQRLRRHRMERGALDLETLEAEARSEERRVGKEVRSGWSPYH